jgi:uncharacterized protein (DUF2132 family)
MTEPTPSGVPTPAKAPESPAPAEPRAHPNDPLHGITLETIIKTLVDRHGWKEMAHRIPIRCFMFDPTMTSSLKFLRKTPWARQKVEDWYVLENRQYQR